MAATQVLVEMGERLRRQRKKMKMTQEETAELLEISTTFYGEIERGNKRLSIEKILLVYKKMDLDPTYLLFIGKYPSFIGERTCIYRNTLSVLPSFDELCDRNPRLSIIKRKNNENKTKNSVQQRTCVCKVLDSISLYRLRRTPFGT